MPMNSTQHAQARLFLADPGTSAVQSIQIENAVGGTFTITFNGQTTAPIAYNAQASDVQNALAALSNIGTGNIGVASQPGVPSTSFFVLYFQGALANAAQPVVTVNAGSLTGTGVLVLVQQVMAGGVVTFQNADLDTLYDYAESVFPLAIAYAFDVLVSNSAKFDDYVAGQSNEKKAQIYEHLKERAEWWHQWANAGMQVQFTRLQPEPPRERAIPYITPQPTSLLATTGAKRWGWRSNGGWGWW